MNTQWVIRRGMHRYGPYATDELRALFRENRVAVSDRIRDAGNFEGWSASMWAKTFGTADGSRPAIRRKTARVWVGATDRWPSFRRLSYGVFGTFVFLNWAGMALVALLIGQLMEIAMNNCCPQPSCER
jgi:hypothetical protein